VQSTIFILLNQNNIFNMRIYLHPKYKQHEKAIIQLVESFFDAGDLIVKGSRNTIKSNILEGEKVNIKFLKTRICKINNLLFFRSTKAKRSYDYANYLIQDKISTPLPIAYIEYRNKLGLLGDSFYISQQIDYDFTIRELIHDPLFPERNIILEQFTEFTYKMHEAKVNFLDHSPGNTLIVKKAPEVYDFYLIDLNRMKFENLTIEARMDNFKKCGCQEQWLRLLQNLCAIE